MSAQKSSPMNECKTCLSVSFFFGLCPPPRCRWFCNYCCLVNLTCFCCGVNGIGESFVNLYSYNDSCRRTAFLQHRSAAEDSQRGTGFCRIVYKRQNTANYNTEAEHIHFVSVLLGQMRATDQLLFSKQLQRQEDRVSKTEKG